MACGVPCICSDVGGCAETVRHGEDGYILHVNTAEEIAAYLKPIAVEEGLWTRLARNSVARHAAMFTAGRMADSWEQLYREGNGG
jgi:glycosyltransferase involved in cell wall biosynthesis